MNATLKTVLLTVLTLSAFTIAMIEVSGISKTAIYNKFHGQEIQTQPGESVSDVMKRDAALKNMPKTSFEFENSKHDFGKMVDGQKARWAWKFKNTGPNPLMISNVQTSCGCTAPFFPKDPIMPGATDSVVLEFNSAGKEGHVNKNALVIANVDNSPYSIGFVAEVSPKN